MNSEIYRWSLGGAFTIIFSGALFWARAVWAHLKSIDRKLEDFIVRIERLTVNLENFEKRITLMESKFIKDKR